MRAPCRKNMMRPLLPRLIQEETSLTMLNRLGKEAVPDAWLADLAEDSYYRTAGKIHRADLPILECSTNTVRFSADSDALICTSVIFKCSKVGIVAGQEADGMGPTGTTDFWLNRFDSHGDRPAALADVQVVIIHCGIRVSLSHSTE